MRKFQVHRRLLTVCAILASALIGLVILLHKTGHRVVTLRGGQTLEWLGVTTGTNRLRYGSPLRMVLGDLIPVRGFKLGPWVISPPAYLNNFDDADACAWLTVRGLGPIPT